MKLGKIGSALAKTVEPLQRLQASGSAAHIDSLSKLFNEFQDTETQEFIKAGRAVSANSQRVGVTLKDMHDSLSDVIAFAKATGATKGSLTTLDTALSCVSATVAQDISFDDFADAMRAELNVDVVQLYLDKLEETLGNEQFDDLFAELESDRRVKKPDMVQITSKFVTHTAKSTSRKECLKRIYARHASLIDSSHKREWQKGKSAA